MSNTMRYSNVMLDIETLDTRASAIVLSIGLCTFGPSPRGIWEIGEGAYSVLSTKDQQRIGRTTSTDTLDWWSKQSDAARKVLVEADAASPADNRAKLESLLEFFAPKCTVWGNGSDFDNVLVHDLYSSYEFSRPWSHAGNRCYRTLKAFAGVLGVHIRHIERTGVHHNAYDDAVTQAMIACSIFNELTGIIDDDS